MERENKKTSRSKANLSENLRLGDEIKNVVIVGATGVGKSTVGYQLSKLLGFGLYDIDQEIERRSGKSIIELFNNDGVDVFRDLESTIVQDLIKIRNHVIVCGAGLLDREENHKIIEKLGVSVWLDSSIPEMVARFLACPDELKVRPKLADILNFDSEEGRRKELQKRLVSLLEKRKSSYQQATISIVCGFSTPSSCAQSIKVALLSQANHLMENVDKPSSLEK